MNEFAHLRELVAGMELPDLRKQVRDLSDVAWLSRNMHILNSKHENFSVAVEECRTLLTFT
jgi:hypothetical protein